MVANRKSGRQPSDPPLVGEALFGLVITGVRHTTREISLTALSSLGTLERTGPRRITELALIEGVTQPSMTALIIGLEKAGMVQRRRNHGDGRVVEVVITDGGSAYVQARRRDGAEVFNRLVEKLPPNEAASLLAAAAALTHLRDLDGEMRVPSSQRSQSKENE